MSFDPVTAGLNLLDKAADKFFMDKAEKEKFKLEARGQDMKQDLTKFVSQIESQMKVIIAEASGSFMQRNWRPGLMILFGVIIANNYIIYPYASLFFTDVPMLEIPPDMWSLLKIGLGGYVVGRSCEKAVKEYKK